MPKYISCHLAIKVSRFSHLRQGNSGARKPVGLDSAAVIGASPDQTDPPLAGRSEHPWV